MTALPTSQSTKPVLQSLPRLPTLNVKMGFSGSQQCDPIRQVEKDMVAFSTDIGHNSDSLYNNLQTSCLVHKYESKDDEERRENQESGYGDLTDAQVCIRNGITFSCYDDGDDWLFKDDYNNYGYNDTYADMLDNGEMVDADWSCRMNPMSMGASIDGFGDELNDPYAGYDTYNSNNDPQFGEDASPESLADASADTSPAIKSNVDLSSQFAKATSAEPEAQESAAPEPVTIEPVPVAANNPSYQMSA